MIYTTFWVRVGARQGVQGWRSPDMVILLRASSHASVACARCPLTAVSYLPPEWHITR